MSLFVQAAKQLAPYIVAVITISNTTATTVRTIAARHNNVIKANLQAGALRQFEAFRACRLLGICFNWGSSMVGTMILANKAIMIDI